MKFKFFVPALIFIFIMACPSFGADILLKDGTKINGTILESPEGKIKIEKNGEILIFDLSKVKQVIMSKDENIKKKSNQNIDPSIKKILDLVPDTKNYPNAGAIILEDEDKYTLNNDGSYKIYSHMIVKLLEDRALYYSKYDTYYDTERENFNIILARTILPNGEVFNVEPSMITEGDPYEGMQFYIANQKQISFSFPNAVKGAILEYITEHTVHKAVLNDYFAPSIYFIADEPKLHTKTTVTFPKNKKIQYIAKNFDKFYDPAFESLKPLEKPQIINDKDTTSYVWEAENIPEIITETMMPYYKNIVPRIQLSSYQSWDKIFDWYNEKFNAYINDIDDDIKNKVTELTENLSTLDEKVAVLYHYVQQNNRYISIKGDIVSSLAGHSATRTFHNKYGDCVDKAILLSAMLKLINVPAYPVLLMAGGGDWDIEIPNFYMNHSITYAIVNGNEVWLDSTSSSHRYPDFRADDQDRWVMVPGLRKFIKTSLPDNAGSIQKLDMNVDEKGNVKVSGYKLYSGFIEANTRNRYKNMKQQEVIDSYKARLNKIFNIAILKYLKFSDLMDLNTQVKEEFEYIIPDYSLKAGNLIFLTLPGYDYRFSEIDLKNRMYPLDYENLDFIQREIIITIPVGFTISYIPKGLNIETAYMLFNTDFIQTGEREIKFTENFRTLTRYIPPQEYQNYKNDLQKIMTFCEEKMVIKRQ